MLLRTLFLSQAVFFLASIILLRCNPQLLRPAEIHVLEPVSRPSCVLFLGAKRFFPEVGKGFEFIGELESVTETTLKDPATGRVMPATAYSFSEVRIVSRGSNRPRRFTIKLSIVRRYVPSLTRGEVYKVRYYFHHNGPLMPPSIGVVIRQIDGKLVYLLSMERAVPLSELPAGVWFDSTRDPVSYSYYTDDLGCLFSAKHLFTQWEAEGRRAVIGPGRTIRIRSVRAVYELTILDNSRIVMGQECLWQGYLHYSVLIQLAESP